MIDEMQYIKDTLYDFITGVMEEEGQAIGVVQDNNNGPRPVPPFIAIGFTGGETPGFPNYGMVNDEGEQKITQKVQKTVTLKAVAESAKPLLETVRAATFKNTWRDYLKQKKLTIPRVFSVVETAGDVDNMRESSAGFDFDLTYLRVFTDTPGVIEHVTITPEGVPLGEFEIDDNE